MFFRMTDLAIKALVKAQHRRVSHLALPRLAVVPTEHIGLAVTSTGLYEADEIALVKSLASSRSLSDTVYLDIGANFGNHACALGGSFRAVLAFEPNPPIAALLKANLLLNGLDNAVVYEVGLGETNAELPFAVAEPGNDGSGAFGVAGPSDRILPVRNGDAFLRAQAPDLDPVGRRIGFIKCDVQGFERNVFAGLRQTLTTHGPIIMFESEGLREGEGSWEILRSVGYKHIARIRAPGDDKGKIARELTRMMLGTACRLEPISAIPDGHCNLLVSVDSLPVFSG